VFGCALWLTAVLAVFVAPAPGTDWRGCKEEEFDVGVVEF